MKRGLGIFAKARRIIFFVLIMILLLAALPYFNWDPIAMCIWAISKVWDFIITAADHVSRNPSVRETFGH